MISKIFIKDDKNRISKHKVLAFLLVIVLLSIIGIYFWSTQKSVLTEEYFNTEPKTQTEKKVRDEAVKKLVKRENETINEDSDSIKYPQISKSTYDWFYKRANAKGREIINNLKKGDDKSLSEVFAINPDEVDVGTTVLVSEYLNNEQIKDRKHFLEDMTILLESVDASGHKSLKEKYDNASTNKDSEKKAKLYMKFGKKYTTRWTLVLRDRLLDLAEQNSKDCAKEYEQTHTQSIIGNQINEQKQESNVSARTKMLCKSFYRKMDTINVFMVIESELINYDEENNCYKESGAFLILNADNKNADFKVTSYKSKGIWRLDKKEKKIQSTYVKVHGSSEPKMHNLEYINDNRDNRIKNAYGIWFASEFVVTQKAKSDTEKNYIYLTKVGLDPATRIAMEKWEKEGTKGWFDADTRSQKIDQINKQDLQSEEINKFYNRKKVFLNDSKEQEEFNTEASSFESYKNRSNDQAFKFSTDSLKQFQSGVNSISGELIN